jgi:hypothetical protein
MQREGNILKGRHADEVMRKCHGLHELETRKEECHLCRGED